MSEYVQKNKLLHMTVYYGASNFFWRCVCVFG